jgi:proline dehydrogenase
MATTGIAGFGRRVLYGLATSSRFEAVATSNRLSTGAAHRAARRFVAGRTLDEAMHTVRRLVDSGLGVSLDLFGEGLAEPGAAGAIVEQYRAAATALRAIGGDVHLEIVPSHLGLDFGVDVCRHHVENIVDALPGGARLEISAEESRRTPHIIELALGLARSGAPVIVTLQANLKRTATDADRLIEAGIPIRLVKGAYLEDPGTALPWGAETDIAFIRLAHHIHANDCQLVLATHDPVIREALLLALPGTTIEMLLGVREHDATELVRRGHDVRIYAPYGPSWFRYWMRRLAEAQGP